MEDYYEGGNAPWYSNRNLIEQYNQNIEMEEMYKMIRLLALLLYAISVIDN